MTKPASIKLKRNECIELTLTEANVNEMCDFEFDGSKITAKDGIAIGRTDTHAWVHARWSGNTSVTIADSKDSRTIIIRMEKQSLKGLDEDTADS